MTSPASADSDFSPAGKRHRERRYHTVTVPGLRLVGFTMITALIAFRQQFVQDSGGWSRTAAIAAGFLAYNAITWIALCRWFGRVRAINLGDAVLALDLAICGSSNIARSSGTSKRSSCCCCISPISMWR